MSSIANDTQQQPTIEIWWDQSMAIRISDLQAHDTLAFFLILYFFSEKQWIIDLIMHSFSHMHISIYTIPAFWASDMLMDWIHWSLKIWVLYISNINYNKQCWGTCRFGHHQTAELVHQPVSGWAELAESWRMSDESTTQRSNFVSDRLASRHHLFITQQSPSTSQATPEDSQDAARHHCSRNGCRRRKEHILHPEIIRLYHQQHNDSRCG